MEPGGTGEVTSVLPSIAPRASRQEDIEFSELAAYQRWLLKVSITGFLRFVSVTSTE